MKHVRLIVYGGRDRDTAQCLEWLEANLMLNLEAAFNERCLITLLGEGDAKGADRAGKLYAQRYLPANALLTVKAEWERYGTKVAGPVRNAELFHRAMPHAVCEFPGGYGTANMRSLVDGYNRYSYAINPIKIIQPKGTFK